MDEKLQEGVEIVSVQMNKHKYFNLDHVYRVIRND